MATDEQDDFIIAKIRSATKPGGGSISIYRLSQESGVPYTVAWNAVHDTNRKIAHESVMRLHNAVKRLQEEVEL